STRTLWLDEASAYWIAQGSVHDLLRGVGEDGTPPLFYLVLKLAIGALGSGEFVLRLPSLICSLALVPLMFVAIQRVAGRRAGLIAAALAAFSPLVNYYAVEARNYALLQIETGLVLYAFVRATRSPERAKWWALLSACQALQLFTH